MMKLNKATLAILTSVYGSAVQAAESTKPAALKNVAEQGASPLEPLSYGNAANVISSLLVILVLLFVMAWVLRRGRGLLPHGSGKIAISSQISLGIKEKVVLLRVGNQNVLVGSSAGNLRTLHAWEGDEPADIEGAVQMHSFAQYLTQLSGKNPANDQGKP